MPRRIQRRRTKGWRMPEGAVYVGRPTRWGNPWRVGDERVWTVGSGGRINREPHGPLTAEQAVESFRYSCENWIANDPKAPYFADLRGRDLACWCPLEDEHGNQVPCHADVLLEIANRGDGQ